MAGLRVGVTAGRRGNELVEALTRFGARVVWGPTVEVVPAPAVAVQRQTAAVLSARPTWVIVITAEGLNRWIDTTRDFRAALLELMAGSKVAARGAKAVAACMLKTFVPVMSAGISSGVN